MEIRSMLMPLGSLGRNGAKLAYRGVTIHNTENQAVGADARRNAQYLLNNAYTKYNSWHYTVDDKEAVRSIPEDEEAMHTGSREGNHTTVGIEIAENADGDILKATNNAAWLAADILRRHGQTKAIWKTNIFQHNDWTGKNCPAQIRRGNPYDWATFVNKVNFYLAGGGRPLPGRTLRLVKDSPLRGDDVRRLQERLKVLGFFSGREDGIFGEETERAVRSFQKSRGLTVDGIVGHATWKALGI